MTGRIWLPDIVPMSKQHAWHRSHGGNGRMMYRDNTYTAWRDAINRMARTELTRQGWNQPVQCRCALRISYHGRFDVDNACGAIQDALQGAAYLRDSQVILATYRKRLKGPVGLSIIIHTLEA